MKSALKTAQNKTFRFEARTPNGKWFVCGRNVSAVEADAYAKKYLNDPNFRVVPAQLPFDATTIGQMLQHHISTRPPALSKGPKRPTNGEQKMATKIGIEVPKHSPLHQECTCQQPKVVSHE